MDRVGWIERGAGVSLLLATELLLYMPADREGERAGNFNLLHFHRSSFMD